MINTKTDNKNIDFSKLLKQLRNDIDLHRLIGLNSKALKKSTISDALLGHIQKLAHASIAICICKIYENQKRNELDSIPGIIESLPKIELTDENQKIITDFGMRYGNSSSLTDIKSYLKETLDLFISIHSLPFNRLKRYRDKIGAHSESNVSMPYLPSHDEFEAFFCFAKDFYDIISGTIINVGPAVIERRVGNGFFKLMKSVRIEEPKYDFAK